MFAVLCVQKKKENKMATMASRGSDTNTRQNPADDDEASSLLDLSLAAKTWEAEVAATSRVSVDVVAAFPPTSSPSSSSKSKVTLTWHNLRYTVYPNGKTKPSKDVLKGLTGAALPHHVMALMGPTGSGKTSLLNVLSGRVPSGGELTGEVNVNGEPRGDDFSQRVAYVMQEELLFAFLSVHETLMLHARLRLPPRVSDAAKTETVRRLIAELGLKNVADSPVGRVGGFPRGLSGGERKRCNIAVEMVRDPAAIFLDEPTSVREQSIVPRPRPTHRPFSLCRSHRNGRERFGRFQHIRVLDKTCSTICARTKDFILKTRFYFKN